MERSRLKDSKSGASAIEAGSEFQMGIILGEREREREKERERKRERERETVLVSISSK